MKRIHAIALLAVNLISGCSVFAPVQPSGAARPEVPKIVFLTLKAVRTENQTCLITLEEVRWTDGRIKKGIQRPLLYPTQAVFEDAAHRSLNQTTIEHPLVADFEYAGEDGRLTRLTRIQDSARVILRLALPESAKFLTIQSSHPDIPLINTTIPLSL